MKNKKNDLTKPSTLFDYFLIIGVDPRIALDNYLYNTNIDELNIFYINDEINPKILSKFPPLKKPYIDINSSIIELCFPNGYKIEKFETQPEPVIEHLILDNSFYSMEYLLKYVTVLKFYESFENYFLLKNEIRKQLGEEYVHNSWKLFGTGKKNTKFKSVNNLYEIISDKNRKKSEFQINSDTSLSKNLPIFKKYFFPKIICLVSVFPFFNEQEKIINQIYNYYTEKAEKKIPLEKIILTVLLNIPIPPKGLVELKYNLLPNYEKILIKNQKMNELSNINIQLKLIFEKFSINKILIIFFNIVFESKILFFGTKLTELTYFIHGMISLLFPFQYSFQISSSIPREAFDVLESISPFILGFNYQFNKNFFTKNKIDSNDLNLFIIDLDNNSLKRIGKDNLPHIPPIIFSKLYNELNQIFGTKKNIKNIDFNKVRNIFLYFFVDIMNNYENYLNKDYFMKKSTNTGLKSLFKIGEFLEFHKDNKDFYQKFIDTQMFSDFITKKLIPKDKKENLEILFFDESIQKKYPKKVPKKQKKNIVFINSKLYDFSTTYDIPQAKILSKIEKKFLENEDENNNMLLFGTKIFEKKNKKNEIEYSFKYYLFPVLNKNFYESMPSNEYFLSPENALNSDLDKINTEILIKSMSITINNKNNYEIEMQNYIYLTYIELWGFCYWYLDASEKDKKFLELMKILDKATNHEMDLFENLFKALFKFREIDKILTLYEILLKYKITPSSYIFSLVNKFLKKKNNNNNNSNNNNNISEQPEINSKRTFHSFNENIILGDKVIFHIKQPCPECFKNIDILELSLNFKNMKKNIFWAQCPFCKKEIIPQMDVQLGKEIILSKDDNEGYTCKKTRFTLLSVYEVKNNLKEIKNKDHIDNIDMFHIEHFKENYPNLFWSCVWYFKLNKIDLDIILPYERSISYQSNVNKSLPVNLSSSIKSNENKNQNNSISSFIKRQNKKKDNKIKNDIFIINSVHSFKIIPKKVEINIINDIKNINPEKKKRFSLDVLFMPYFKMHKRLNTSSEKNIKSKNKANDKNKSKLYENYHSNNTKSFKYEDMIEKNEEEDIEEIYSNKVSINIVNYEENSNTVQKARKSYQHKASENYEIIDEDINYKRNKSEESKKSKKE